MRDPERPDVDGRHHRCLDDAAPTASPKRVAPYRVCAGAELGVEMDALSEHYRYAVTHVDQVPKIGTL